jgi:hypothetical protein
MKKLFINYDRIKEYISIEKRLAQKRASALDLIILSKGVITSIDNDLSSKKNNFLIRNKIITEDKIREEREYIFELETGLLLVKYLYKIYQGFSENILNAIKVRRGRHIARKEALQFTLNSNLDICKIDAKIEEITFIIKTLFPENNSSKEGVMSPEIFNREYIFTLEEIKSLIKLYSRKRK